MYDHRESVEIYRNLIKSNPLLMFTLGLALNKLGELYTELDRPEEALKPTQQAVTIIKFLAALNPTNFKEHLDRSLNNLNTIYARLGRPPEELPSIESLFLDGD